MTHSSMRYLLSNRCEYLCLDTRSPSYQLWRLITATFMKITSYRGHHANEYKLRRLPVLLSCCRALPLHEDIGRVKTGSPLKLINAVAPGSTRAIPLACWAILLGKVVVWPTPQRTFELVRNMDHSPRPQEVRIRFESTYRIMKHCSNNGVTIGFCMYPQQPACAPNVFLMKKMLHGHHRHEPRYRPEWRPLSKNNDV